MSLTPKLATVAFALTFVAACAKESATPTGLVRTGTTASLGGVEIKQPKIKLDKSVRESQKLAASAPLPAGATGIGPGTMLLITIPNDGSYGCSANFIWSGGSKLYLGAAGHCFIPATTKATHGAGADYDASGVTVEVCVSGCEGNIDTSLLLGQWVTLGPVAYSRQTDPTGTEDIGNDFGIVEIPAAAAHMIRTGLPVWGSHSGVTYLEFGQFGCHYGNGIVTGETVATKARVGVGGGGDESYWMGDFVASPGDSGSGLISCTQKLLGFKGDKAVGILTHLGVGTGDIEINGVQTRVEHGYVFGTTVRRAVEMAQEAGLAISIVQ